MLKTSRKHVLGWGVGVVSSCLFCCLLMLLLLFCFVVVSLLTLLWVNQVKSLNQKGKTKQRHSATNNSKAIKSSLNQKGNTTNTTKRQLRQPRQTDQQDHKGTANKNQQKPTKQKGN